MLSPVSSTFRHAGRQALLAGLAAVGLLSLMAAGYASRLNPVTLLVDGAPSILRTNQTTVEGVLREAGLALSPEDRVQPPPSADIQPNATIRISRARPVEFRADGETIRVRTHAATLAEALAEQGITVGPHDALSIDGDPAGPAMGFVGWPTTPHTIAVRRAVPLTIAYEDGTQQAIETTQPNIGQALAAAGIELYVADWVTPGLSARVTPGGVVRVERSVPASVQVDGRTIRTRTHAERAGDLLAELGVALHGQDYTQPALDAEVQPDLQVRVVRVREELLIQQEPIPFETQILPDPESEIDTAALVQDGETGVLQKRIRVRYEDGQEVSRAVDDSAVVRAPRPKIFTYGTRIVIRSVDTPQGPREYWRKFRAYATSYSAATAGTPKTAPWYGLTATGLKMRKGIVAVDPDIISLRTELYVPGYGVGYAGDTGGGVIGRWVDLGYDDDNLVAWHQWVDVYLLTPVPPADKIEYRLPDWPRYPGR